MISACVDQPSFRTPDASLLRIPMKTPDGPYVIGRLERERLTFTDSANGLLQHQQKSFQLCCNLLNEEPMLQKQKSLKQRYSRLRAQTFLIDAFTGLGLELFFLCTLSLPVSDLANARQSNLFPVLREWWKSVPHPRGLKHTASDSCAASSLELIVQSASASGKRKHSDRQGIPSVYLLILCPLSANNNSFIKQTNQVRDQSCYHPE